MDVTFIRIDARRYVSRAIRDDGVTVQIPGYDNPAYLPHDLAHFLVEREYMPDSGSGGCRSLGSTPDWGRVAVPMGTTRRVTRSA